MVIGDVKHDVGSHEKGVVVTYTRSLCLERYYRNEIDNY